MPYKAVYTIIWAPTIMNEIMKAADLFEQGKVLGDIYKIEVNFDGEPEPDMLQAAKAIEALKDLGDKMSPRHIISLVSLMCVVSGNHIVLNTGQVKPYWNSEVRIISTGKQWFMLHKYLSQQGYKVTTDQHLYVTAVD